MPYRDEMFIRTKANGVQWIDSCCIDKSSSAELSEAINSMFEWYKNAQVCYTYLFDVSATAHDHEREGSAFRDSTWWTVSNRHPSFDLGEH
jgi:hypothetical protein